MVVAAVMAVSTPCSVRYARLAESAGLLMMRPTERKWTEQRERGGAVVWGDGQTCPVMR